jgi:hypothetical protein
MACVRGTMWMLAAASAACSPRALQPPAYPGARSAILLVEGPDRGAFATDIDGSDPGIGVPIGADAVLWMLFYTQSLEERHLPHGRLTEASPLEHGVPLPKPIEAFRTEVRNHSASPWMADDFRKSDLYKAFRIPAESPIQCAQRDGCYADPEDTECTAPCPSPLAPEPPDFADLPELPKLMPCPDGWNAVELDFLPVEACDPFPAGRSSCPSDQLLHPGALGCEMLSEPCPGGDGFPPLVGSGPFAYVRAGATGGDGSRARPFGRIPDALATLSAGTTILLAPGTYDDAVRLTTTATIAGACASEVIVRGDLAIEGTSAAIRGLRLQGTVSIAAGRSAEIEDSAIEASDAVAASVGQSARLRLAHARILGSISASEGSSVDLATVDLAGEVKATKAALEARDLYLRGGFEISEGSLVVSRSGVIVSDKAAIRASSSLVDLRDVFIGGAAPAPLSGVTLAQGHLDAARLRIDTVSTGIELDLAATASVSDAFVAPRDLNQPAIVLKGSRAGFERLVVFASLFAVDEEPRDPRSESAVSVTNLVAVSTGRGIGVHSRSTFSGRRMYFRDTIGQAVLADGARSAVDPDIDLEDVRLVDAEGGFAISGDRALRVRRTTMVGLRSAGVELGNNSDQPTDAPVLDASGVFISGGPHVTGPGSCGEGLSCQGSVAIARGLAKITAFVLESSPAAGVVITDDVDITLADGVFRDLSAGFSITGTGPDLRSLLTHTRFEHVDRICDPCGN